MTTKTRPTRSRKPKKPHRTHENSLESYYAGKEEAFTKRTLEVLSAFREIGTATDRQIQDHLGYAERNAVQPRITELLQDGVLEEVEPRVWYPVTRRHVRRCRLRPPPTNQTEISF